MYSILNVSGGAKCNSHVSSGTYMGVLANLHGEDTTDSLDEVSQALVDKLSTQRRRHRKSRKGCHSCKSRRVKCDERWPCSACVRRGDSCVRTNLDPGKAEKSTEGLESRWAAQSHVTPSHAAGALAQHFATHTSSTLMLCDTTWTHALKLASRYGFLESIITSVAAQHLYVLNSEDRERRITAARYLDRGLASFRGALSCDLTSTHIDAFVAASLLILHYLWADVDHASYDSFATAQGPLPDDNLFEVSASLKQVFLKSVRLAPEQDSTFMPHVSCDPTMTLLKSARIDKLSLNHVQDMLSRRRPVTMAMLDLRCSFTRGTQNDSISTWTAHLDLYSEDQYAEAVARLCLIMSFMPESNPPEPLSSDPTLMQVAARFVISFPILCRGHFADLLQQRDLHAMVILYHFYRAASVLLPHKKYWWAWKRATLAPHALRRWIEGCINGQTAIGMNAWDSATLLDVHSFHETYPGSNMVPMIEAA